MPSDGVVIYIYNPVENIVIGANNPGQNIWNNVKQWSKIRHEKKSFISTFELFFNRYYQDLISQREDGGWAMFPPKYKIFIIFPNFLTS